MNDIICQVAGCKNKVGNSNFCSLASITINDIGKCVEYKPIPMPCCFCKGEAEIVKNDIQGRECYSVTCSVNNKNRGFRCKAWPNSWCATEELAIESWNRSMKFNLENNFMGVAEE